MSGTGSITASGSRAGSVVVEEVVVVSPSPITSILNAKNLSVTSVKALFHSGASLGYNSGCCSMYATKASSMTSAKSNRRSSVEIRLWTCLTIKAQIACESWSISLSAVCFPWCFFPMVVFHRAIKSTENKTTRWIHQYLVGCLFGASL